MTFNELCNQISRNEDIIHLLINEELLNHAYAKPKLAEEIIDLQNLLMLKLQNPEVTLEIGIRNIDNLLNVKDCTFLDGPEKKHD